MNAPMEFPPLAEVPPAALAPLSIKETVLAQFRAEEPALIALADKYRNVAYDCKTPKGLQAAKDARHELRTTGRYSLQNAEKRIKREVNELKDVMAAEVERLIAIVKPVEDSIDGQIKAREAEIEAERLAREQAEAARRAEAEAGIAKIAGYVEQARGRTSAEIAQALQFVRETIIIEPEAWGDYAARAQATLNATLQGLEKLHTATLAEEQRQAEAARVAAENARIAAELEAQRQAQAAQQAEIERQRQELAVQQEVEAQRLRQTAAVAFADLPGDEPQASGEPAAEDPAAQRRAEQAAMTHPNGAPMFSEPVKDNGDLTMLDPQGNRSVFCDVDEGDDPAPAASVIVDPAVGTAAAAPQAASTGTYYAPAELADSLGHTEAPAPDPGLIPNLSLSDLSTWAGFNLTQAFMTDTLGILPAGQSPRKTPLYREADKPDIKAALLRHVEGLPA